MSQLENKIQDAVETIELYRQENEELKEKNKELEEQHQAWEEKLSLLITKFETISEQGSSNSLDNSNETENFDPSESYESSIDSDESEQDASVAYSSTTSIGNQAVASTSYYSSHDE